MSKKKKRTKEDKSTDSKHESSKKPAWDAKAIAPSSWVETLLSATRSLPNDEPRALPNDEAISVLIEMRSGRRGAAMIVDALPFRTVGIDATDSIMPLAIDCWDLAKEKRAEIDDDKQYDARIRVVETDETGATRVSEDSDWVLLDSELCGSSDDEVWGDFGKGGHGSSEAWAIARVMGSQNKELFRANISLVRAAGWLVRESIAGQADRLNTDYAQVEKIRQMATDLIDSKMEMARAEGDAQEVREFGATARTWITKLHEEKLAEKGVEPPSVPDTRATAAKGLRQSLTIGQLDALVEKIGEDRAELIQGLIKNAGSMPEDQIEVLIETEFGTMEKRMEMMSVFEKIFSTDYVPSSWAIWQVRTASVLIEGPKEKAA